MNKYQRLVLIIGAVALVISLWTVPKWVEYNGSVLQYSRALALNDYRWQEWEKKLKEGKVLELRAPEPVGAPFRDYNEVAIRTISVIGATLLIFFALKGLQKK